MKTRIFWSLCVFLFLVFSQFVYGEEKAIKIKGSWQNTCALTDQHRLYCWGGVNFQDFTKGIKVKDFDLGAKEICALTLEGKIICNQDGKTFTPEMNHDFITLSTREEIRGPCGIKNDQTLICKNFPNDLKGIKAKTLFNRSEPNYLYICALQESGKQFCFDGGWKEPWFMLPEDFYYKKLALGYNYRCGITLQDHVICTEINFKIDDSSHYSGYVNLQRKYGVGDTSVPTDLDEKTSYFLPEHKKEVIYYTDSPPPLKALDIAAGDSHACAVKMDHSVVCWGYSQYGQLDVPEGLKAVAVSANIRSSCAINLQGKVVCWGNQYRMVADAPKGKVKDLSTYIEAACAILENDDVVCWGEDKWILSRKPKGLKAKQVEVSRSYTCALQFNDEVICWGVGQARPPLKGKFKSIHLTDYGTIQNICGVTIEEELICKKDDYHKYQNLTPKSSIKKVSSNKENPWLCILTEKNKILCDVRNTSHEGVDVIVMGRSIFSYCFINLKNEVHCRWKGKVQAHPKFIGFKARALFNPYYQTLCAIGVDDTLLCWGKGDSNFIPYPKEVQNVETMSEQNRKAQLSPCLIQKDGTPLCWGSPRYLQHQVPKGLKVKSIHSPSNYTCAITLDDHLKCWGSLISNRAPIPKEIAGSKIN